MITALVGLPAQWMKPLLGKFRIPMPTLLSWRLRGRTSGIACIFYGVLQLVRRLVLAEIALSCSFALCESYRKHYRPGFRETGASDCSIEGYRRNGKPLSLLGFHQRLSRMRSGECKKHYAQCQTVHIRCGLAYLSKSSRRLRRRIYQLFSRNAECLWGYTLSAFEPPVFGCQTPDVRSVAGNFCFPNYSTTQIRRTV